MRKVLLFLVLILSVAPLEANVTRGIAVPGHYARPFGGVVYTPIQPTIVVLTATYQFLWHIAVYDSAGVYQGEYTLLWGILGDTFPPARDWDGDGYDDPTVYRPSTGTFYVLPSTCDWACSRAYPVP